MKYMVLKASNSWSLRKLIKHVAQAQSTCGGGGGGNNTMCMQKRKCMGDTTPIRGLPKTKADKIKHRVRDYKMHKTHWIM